MGVLPLKAGPWLGAAGGGLLGIIPQQKSLEAGVGLGPSADD